MWLKSFGQSIKQVSSLSWSSRKSIYRLCFSPIKTSIKTFFNHTCSIHYMHVNNSRWPESTFLPMTNSCARVKRKATLTVLNHLQYSLKNDCFHSNVIIPPDATLCLSRRYLHTHKHTYTAIRIPLFFDLSLTLSLSLFSCTQTLISFSNYTPW